jgi:surface-adhesin protein E
MLVLCVVAIVRPAGAAAQETWTGIGSISGTAMFMDTTTIVRAGSIRKVWIKSLDRAPKKFVAGKDTLTFDTVVALNVFDCAKQTRTVVAVQYELEGEVVLDVPETRDSPAPVRPGSFFGAVYNGLCGDAR